MSKIEIQKVVEKMDLKNLTPDVGLADKYVEVPDINRPALQLTGFFDHFDAERVQIIGYVEYTFLEQMDPETKRRVYETLLAYKIPCIIFCRDLEPDKELLEKAKAELFNLRFAQAVGNLEDHGRMKTVRRDIARIYTIARERELGYRTAPSTEE